MVVYGNYYDRVQNIFEITKLLLRYRKKTCVVQYKTLLAIPVMDTAPRGVKYYNSKHTSFHSSSL